MSRIKLVNEEKNISYDTEESVINLLYYIFDICKTSYDKIRPGHMLGDFRGCEHFFGTEAQALDPELVALQMLANNRAYGKWQGNLMKHRVISFRELDSVMPNEAFDLAAYIAKAYGENYITAYGIHMDTNNIHIHLAIDTISWKDGSRFNISYELKWLWAVVGSRMGKRDEYLLSNYRACQRRDDYYGF